MDENATNEALNTHNTPENTETKKVKNKPSWMAFGMNEGQKSSMMIAPTKSELAKRLKDNPEFQPQIIVRGTTFPFTEVKLFKIH